jgi:hypothetical protein
MPNNELTKEEKAVLLLLIGYAMGKGIKGVIKEGELLTIARKLGAD